MDARATELILTLTQLIDDRIALALQDALADQSDGYYNSEDAADYLACPVSRIHDSAGAGKLKGYKDGSRWLFTREQLDDYVANGGWRAPRPRRRGSS